MTPHEARACSHRLPSRPTAWGTRGRKPLLLLLAAVLLLPLPGCRVMVGGERTIAEENDRLRTLNLRLARQNAELAARVAFRDDELDALRSQLAAVDEAPAIEGVDPPRLTRISLGRQSGPVDLHGDDRHEIIRVYMQPQDQHGRILPVAGRATVRALRIPPDGEAETVAERVYEPEELDRAWRHNITGIHYTLELPLPETLPTGTTELTVHVSLLEAHTGARHTRQQAMTIRR